MTQAEPKYGSWEEWHQRVDEAGREASFHMYTSLADTGTPTLPPKDEIKAWIEIHLAYVSRLGIPSYYCSVPRAELVQAEASRD